MNMVHEVNLPAADMGMAGDSAPLECFLAYEDLLTGLRAKRVLDHVLESTGDRLAHHLQLLRFDLLQYPELHYWAAREAGLSDVVILSTHGARELPEGVKNWLELWLCRKSDRPAALVASLDEGICGHAQESPTVGHLRRLAARSGLALFTHYGGMSAATVRLTVRCIRKRLSRVSRTGENRFLEPRLDGPRWGINE